MQLPNPEASQTGLLILRRLAENSYCANSLASLPIIKSIQVCMKQQPNLVAEAAHALKCLTSQCTGELAEQFLLSDIIPALLSVLSSNLSGSFIFYNNRKEVLKTQVF